MFKINRKILKSSYYITELKLSSIRLHDNSKFPWVILIPKRKNITDVSELNSKDQILLMKEIVYVSKIMKKLFKTDKLNIEKIGNIVPQLHIHIIARNKKDSSWPQSVWVVKEKKYDKLKLTSILNKTLNSPLGVAAGFDKNAEVYNPLYKLGFGFVEVGTITPKPQIGNPKILFSGQSLVLFFFRFELCSNTLNEKLDV